MSKGKGKARNKGAVIPQFKSRFSGLIKMSQAGESLRADKVVIEGEDYMEFAKLPGVFFSAKLFI